MKSAEERAEECLGIVQQVTISVFLYRSVLHCTIQFCKVSYPLSAACGSSVSSSFLLCSVLSSCVSVHLTPLSWASLRPSYCPSRAAVNCNCDLTFDVQIPFRSLFNSSCIGLPLSSCSSCLRPLDPDPTW